MLSAHEPLADNTKVDRDQIARLIRWTLVLTLWTGLGFAHVPASSRDGVESTLFFLNVIVGVPILVAGVLLEWLSPRSLRRRRTSNVP
jgi:hypothetical protein